MMTFRSLALLIALCATLPAQDRRASDVDNIFRDYNKPGTPGAAVAVIEGGKIVFEKGYGQADLEYNAPVTPQTIFHVASVSKQFTAMALVLLEQDGKLSLEDDIHKYLPELPDYGQTITIRNLLQHTSGIRDQWQTLCIAGWRMDDVITQQQILRMLFRQKELNFPPGTRHIYSNGGYTLAAEIVARASGKPFPEFCADRIFKPLDMTSTHFHDDHRRIVPGRAYSYAPAGSGYRAAVLNYANVGATSLFTTAPDLVKWLDNFRRAKVGGRAGINRLQERGVLTTGVKIDYALGVSIGTHRGLKTISHGGGDAGFRSYVVWFPEVELGVAVVSSHSEFNSARIANQVAAVFAGPKMTAASQLPEEPPSRGYGVPEPDEKTAKADVPANLNEYTGAYWSEELETQYTVRVKDGKLIADHAHHGEIVLTSGGTDTFRGSEWFMPLVKFTRDASGRVTGMTAGSGTIGRVNAIRFVRR